MSHFLFGDWESAKVPLLESVSPKNFEQPYSTLSYLPTKKLVDQGLDGCTDGELFLEYHQSQRIVYSEGKVKSASSEVRRGMGLRAESSGQCYFAHSSDLSLNGVRTLFDQLALPKTQANHHTSFINPSPKTSPIAQRYCGGDPLSSLSFEQRVSFLEELNQLARQNPFVQDVTLVLSGHWQSIAGIRPNHQTYGDMRPRAELSVNVIMKRNGVRASGSNSIGGRENFNRILKKAVQTVHSAVDQAERMLEARPAKAGEMDVVLGSGWPGILLHEAIGHGLEGDFNRKKTSVFSELMGHQIASKGVTIVDDGTLVGRRGSLHCDDEGTPAQCTTLIEDGVLVGYMQDRLNGRLMQSKSTGNGRRQSYAHLPMPRMTNTYMHKGTTDQAEMISDISEGIYAVSFGGGSVDITSGQFVFNCTEAYQIQNGKIAHPLSGASVIGMGAQALQGIRAIGNDLELDPGMGMCGKEGQWVPVGVGQPSLQITGLKVGGSQSI